MDRSKDREGDVTLENTLVERMSRSRQPPTDDQPLVSIVIPTFNNERTITACLQAARLQTYPRTELIVVDNHSSDSTVNVAKERANKVLIGGPERSAQRNLGAGEARGQILLFVDSDMLLTPTVAEDTVRTLARDPEIAALVVPELVKQEGGFWVRCRILEKRAYLGDHRVEAARAFRADWFRDIGGFDETLTGPEDWELTDRTIEAGGRVGRIDAPVLHDESQLSLRLAFSKKRYYGRSWVDYRRENMRRGATRLLRPSLARPLRNLPSDPLHVAGLFVLKTSELLGFALGAFEENRRRRKGKRSMQR